ncbi:alcohol dehydrogenase transcription factor myb/SANT-like domain-containing protein [Ditylenchus destructor]|uniref:Alcohol dehydrogenase transcription factor myb/SANT-like domain-containing protein n=1 Tax=Ditylenchus destructor TaxID=166010 RepID=A0AAD4MT59_9BILA|nr:alcohol dehydrogenase transcription factor myb/SANT-like domain-containing protein [Ditylenchus destructor]
MKQYSRQAMLTTHQLEDTPATDMGKMQKDLRLMEAICKHPQLYDKTHSEYLNQKAKGPIWQSIAQETGFDDMKSAQSRWRSIRNAYFASHKRAQSGSDGEATSKYIYAKELSFLHWGAEQKAAHRTFLDYEKLDYEDKPNTQQMNGTMETFSVNVADTTLLSVVDPKPQSDAEWHQFGSHVGSFLARLPDNKKKRELCIKIEQLMLEYEPDE